MNIIDMSLSASVLIAAIVVARGLTLHRLPKKTFLIMWGIAICRLLIPFSISSRFSFFTGVAKLLQAAPAQPAPAAATSVAPVVTEAAFPVTDIIGNITGEASVQPTLPPLFLIWLIGILLCAVLFTVSYIRNLHAFKTALPVDNIIISAWLARHPLRRPVRILQSDRINAPLTYGIFRPVLLLPKTTEWANSDTLHYILMHEYTHIRRFDALFKLILTAVVCIHWFNPLVWLTVVLANRDIEHACDETVVRQFKGANKSAYAMTLIGLEEKKSHLTPLCNGFSKNAINDRIRAIMKTKKLTVPVIIAAVVLVAAVTIIFATSKADAPAPDAAAERPVADASAEAADMDPSTPSGTPPIGTTVIPSSGQALATASVSSNHEVLSQILAEIGIVKISSESETLSSIKTNGMTWPVASSTRVTVPFGRRYYPINKEYVFTDHIDIAADDSTAVCAALDGTVLVSDYNEELGDYIIINHDPHLLTFYEHLSERTVSAGDTVNVGDDIGTVGSTGNVTDPCLSFGVIFNGAPVNPLFFFKDYVKSW